MSKPTQALFIFFLIAMSWGLSFPYCKILFRTMLPGNFIAIRFILAGLVLFAILIPLKKSLFSKKEVTWGTALGLCLGLGYLTQNIGLMTTTSAKCGFITGLYIIQVPFLALLFLKEKIIPQHILGLIFAVVGTGLMSLTTHLRMTTGDLWVLISSLFFALQIVLVSYATLKNKIQPLVLTAWQLFVSGLISWGYSAVFETPRLPHSELEWIIIIATFMLATIFPFFAQAHYQKFTNPTLVALIMSTEAVFAAFFGWLITHEDLSLRELTGCGLIFLGIIITQMPQSWTQRLSRKYRLKFKENL